MANRVVRGRDENMVGRRVDTKKFGLGFTSGEYESIGNAGEFVRYEILLDVPENWPCHSVSSGGPFFEYKELEFI